jgi:hypothetical protein
LFQIWVGACIALGVALIVSRIVEEPRAEDLLWKLTLTVWGAPILLMLLDLVAGSVWFVIWLIVRPFKRFRVSRAIHPWRW